MTDNLEVRTAPCVMHERGERCGPVWYYANIDGVEGHTVGTCAPKGRKFTVDVERTDRQTTVTLLDGKDQPVKAIAWTTSAA